MVMTTSGVSRFTAGRLPDGAPCDCVFAEEVLSLILRPECVRIGDSILTLCFAFFEGDGPDIARGSGDSRSSWATDVWANVLAIVGVAWEEAGGFIG